MITKDIRFLLPSEVETFNWKRIGKNVQIARTAVIDDPSKVSIGDNVIISDNSIITGEVSIGNYTHIAHYVHLSGQKGLSIGKHCGIGSRTTIYTSSDDFRGTHLIGPTYPIGYRKLFSNPVEIGDFVIIGIGSVVFPQWNGQPTHIPEGAAFWRGSLIAGDYSPWTINHSLYPDSKAGYLSSRIKDMKIFAQKLEEDYV